MQNQSRTGQPNWRYIMRVVRSLLLGSAAGLLTVAGAQAADLPAMKAAPVNYVRICDAYGAGFFYIPDTDTCLKVGGLALFETRIFNTPYSIGAGFTSANAATPNTGPWRLRHTRNFAAGNWPVTSCGPRSPASILVPSSCIPAASLTSRSVLSTTRSSP